MTSRGLRYPMPNGKMMLFRPDRLEVCVQDWEAERLQSNENFTDVGECHHPSSEHMQLRGAPMGCNTCGGGPPNTDPTPKSHPDLFMKVTVTNHATMPKPLTGKASGRSYSLRRNGDTVWILKTDYEVEPDKWLT